MILIISALLGLLARFLWKRTPRTRPDGTPVTHPVELLEHAPNNYVMAKSISLIMPLVEWLNRLEDNPRFWWLLRAKEQEQWYTPDAPVGWIFRVLNKVDYWLQTHVGIRIVYIDHKDFLNKCKVLEKPQYKQCEGDESAHGFRLMLDAAEDDHISATGRMMLAQLMNGWLDTRISIDNYVAAHPEVLQVEIKRPIIIIGCPRTASTFMHKLLAQDPGLRKPLFWELAIPSPPPDPASYETDVRRKLCSDGFRTFDAIAPHFYEDVHKHHYFGVNEIEEDSVLCHYAGVLAIHGHALAGDGEYWKWQMRTDNKEAAYKVHRKVLQVLSSKFPQPVQWLLKAPTIHSCFLEQMLKTYPDALLVVTHRQAVEVLPSWSKFILSPMCATLWRHGTKTKFLKTKTVEQLEMFERIERTIARVRQTHGAQMFDVEYTELMADPMGIVQKCYDHFGQPLTPEARAAMEGFIAGRGSGGQNKKYGKVSTAEHAKFLEYAGLSVEEVTERLRVAQLPPGAAGGGGSGGGGGGGGGAGRAVAQKGAGSKGGGARTNGGGEAALANGAGAR